MLQLQGLEKSFGGQTLFSDVSWTLSRSDRVGLVGPNGVGKSTLMRIILGQEPADKGSVIMRKGLSIGYLPQELPRQYGRTALDRVLEGASHTTSLAEQITQIEEALAHANEEEAVALALEHAECLEKYHLHDGVDAEPRARMLLKGLGFSETLTTQPLEELSGGFWMRVELARLLLEEPDVLLLDEPTNHLDLESLAWLELFLKTYPGAYVVVSHDRQFLNTMTTSIAELSKEGVLCFPGNYDHYIEAKAEIEEQLAEQAKQFQKKAEALRGFIARFGAKATKAKQAQSRAKALEKLENQAPQETQKKRKLIRVALPVPPRSGETVLQMRGVCKSYGSRVLYQNVDWSVQRGDKIALVGVNGAGKSTLLKMMAGVLPLDAGTCTWGYQAYPYYFAQHQLETLHPEYTVLQEMSSVMPEHNQTAVRGVLGAFLFGEDAVDKPVKVLSGGEKSRLALAMMLAKPVNVLLLDEPTNHLDLESCQRLEEALVAYPGTIVFISHDRYFINSVATQVVEVCPSVGLRVFPGDYQYYVWKKQEESVPQPSEQAQPSAEQEVKTHAWEQKKEHDREQRKILKQQSLIEEEITKCENSMKNIDALLCEEAIYTDSKRCQELSSERSLLEVRVNELFSVWQGLEDKKNHRPIG
jgi:ATP-binding cassette subfamily F protein 3